MDMKKMLILILILMLSASALASTCDIYFPANGQTYHMVHHVDEEGSWVELIGEHPYLSPMDHNPSDEYVAYDLAQIAAKNEHIAACPYMNNGGAKTISAKTSSGKKPQAVSRGGTIVIRIPWEWINGCEMDGTWWGDLSQAENETLEEVLMTIVPPTEAANKLLGGNDDYTIRTFGFNGVDSKAMRMSSRPLDDAWYCVVRPEKKVSGSFKMHHTVMEYSLSIRDNQLSGSLEREKADQTPIDVSVTPMDGIKAAWKKNYDGFGMVLYEVEGVYIAVITEKNAKKADIEATQLYIPVNGYDYSQVRIDLDGYMDGKNGIYCCVLSEGEFLELKDGAKVRLEHDHSKW